jgi:hypothetical protein
MLFMKSMTFLELHKVHKVNDIRDIPRATYKAWYSIHTMPVAHGVLCLSNKSTM